MKFSKSKTLLAFVIIATIITLIGDIVLYLYNENEELAKENKQEVSIVAKKEYMEINYPTQNYDSDRVNDVIGIVLHHTAEPTIEKSLAILTSPVKKVGSHVVIDTDGTRYIMAKPEVATYHAGRSILNGREGCNYCTVGIEFQGNTLVAPLTDDQIASGIEYLLPIMAKYKIPLENIVTHEMVRTAYKQKYPNKRCSGKVDITSTEYFRFMKELKKVIIKTE